MWPSVCDKASGLALIATNSYDNDDVGGGGLGWEIFLRTQRRRRRRRGRRNSQSTALSLGRLLDAFAPLPPLFPIPQAIQPKTILTDLHMYMILAMCNNWHGVPRIHQHKQASLELPA